MNFLLTGHQLSRLLFNLKAGDFGVAIGTTESVTGLTVSLSKWGTSTLEFAKHQLLGDLWDVELIKEDISWLHRKYVPEIKLKIEELVQEVKK